PATGRAALAAAAFCGAALLHSTVQGSVAYFARPAADRADAYSFDLTALAAAARAPGSTAVVDPYQAMVVSFLDWDAPPTIVAPGTPVPAGAGPVFAVSRTDLAASLGPGVAARPVTIEQPEPAVVWRVDR